MYKPTFWIFCLLIISVHSLHSSVTSISGKISFDVNADGNIEAILNSKGLGIFTTSPSSNLEVGGNALVTERLVVGSSNNTSNSNLHIQGSMGISYATAETLSYSAQNNSVIFGNPDIAGGNMTINLPIVGANTGTYYCVKNMSSNFWITIDGNGFLIDGSPSVRLQKSSNVLASASFIESGGAWHIFSQYGATLSVPAMGNLVCWLDASNNASVSSSSSNVTKIEDLSGKNNHALQQGSGKVPTISTLVHNGLSMLYFSSGGNLAVSSLNLNQQAQTVIIVTLFSLSSTGDYLSSSINWKARIADSATDTNLFADGWVANLSTTNNAVYSRPMISIFTDQVSSRSWIVDGVDITNNSTAGKGMNRVYLGKGNIWAEELTNTYIGELIVYDRALTTIERNNVINYLKRKWSITY